MVAAPHAPQAPAPALPRAVQTPGGSRAPGQRSAELPREPPLRSGAAGRSQASSCACTVGCGGQAPNGDLEEEDRPWEMVGSLKVCAVEAAKYPGNVGIIKLPDAQTRQLQDAVTNVEKHFGELCQIFAAYVRKTARLRDKADLLVNEINVYASTETPKLKQGLKTFADEFSKLQDYRQAEVWSEVTPSCYE
ncbi:hypothetical protein J1605_007756 [Eschrichtius robustus]|uniref:Uncharacterized protein n=1 Tax=Eschrichtius robustus TaxID=9764 RepID=A0AB34H2T1_ESCRO|nr:hypothetical protein J1605_007756 [Eschrichtius robustus]